MSPPLNPSITDSSPDSMAEVRDAMSRRGDFYPSPEHYADESGIFEVMAVLEALTIEGEVLA